MTVVRPTVEPRSPAQGLRQGNVKVASVEIDG
jgi:hypothetical protein